MLGFDFKQSISAHDAASRYINNNNLYEYTSVVNFGFLKRSTDNKIQVVVIVVNSSRYALFVFKDSKLQDYTVRTTKIDYNDVIIDSKEDDKYYVMCPWGIYVI
jgi:hypothetical protein